MTLVYDLMAIVSMDIVGGAKWLACQIFYYSAYFDLFHRPCKNEILQNHNFPCCVGDKKENQLIDAFQLSDCECDPHVPFNCIKREFEGKATYPTLKIAIQIHCQIKVSIPVKHFLEKLK